MTLPHENALRASHRILRVLVAINMAYGVGIAGLLVFSFVAETALLHYLKVDSVVQREAMLLGMRLVAVVGLVAVPLTHLILERLISIVDTVRAGDPFIGANAQRLQTIAWTLLGIQVLHLVIGIIIAQTNAAVRELDMDWSFSLTPWLAVLLLFVLARVFEHGARMRADLEGTV